MLKFVRGNDASGDAAFLQQLDAARKLGDWGDHNAAIRMLKDCAVARPAYAATHFHLGENYAAVNDTAHAAESYARAISLDPDDRLGASVRLALLGAGEVPDRLPDAYVRATFDREAHGFDAHLGSGLGDEPAAVLAAIVGGVRPGSFGRILDLGCGTGLCAAPFKTGSLWMEGVDLSPAMVKEAKRKHLYDALHATGIDAFLAAPQTRYDLVISGDALSCRGALEETFLRVRGVLKDDGLFAFTLRQSGLHPFVLGRDQVYAHHRDYVEEALTAAGFSPLALEERAFRRAHGHPVAGLAAVATDAS